MLLAPLLPYAWMPRASHTVVMMFQVQACELLASRKFLHRVEYAGSGSHDGIAAGGGPLRRAHPQPAPTAPAGSGCRGANGETPLGLPNLITIVTGLAAISSASFDGDEWRRTAEPSGKDVPRCRRGGLAAPVIALRSCAFSQSLGFPSGDSLSTARTCAPTSGRCGDCWARM